MNLPDDAIASSSVSMLDDLTVGLPMAHGGHWTTQLIYVAPLAVLGVLLLRSWWADRRDPGRTEPSSEEPDSRSNT